VTAARRKRPSAQGGVDAAAVELRAVVARGASFEVERVMPSYVQVASQLRALILSGQLALGERLPSETELSSMFGVSRSTTREALRLLAAEKLVEPRRGVTGGTFVVHPEPQDVEETLGTALNLLLASKQIDLRDLVETWTAFGPPAARFAARRRTDDDVATLFALSERPAGPVSEAALTIANIDFHRALLVASGNRLLEMLTRPLVPLGLERQATAKPILPYLLTIMDEHRGIAEAIADHDEDLAAALTASHYAIDPAEHGGRAAP
jgi:GntR family transcriptional repressor for pyruvate dehydrogenase complex